MVLDSLNYQYHSLLKTLRALSVLSRLLAGWNHYLRRLSGWGVRNPLRSEWEEGGSFFKRVKIQSDKSRNSFVSNGIARAFNKMTFIGDWIWRKKSDDWEIRRRRQFGKENYEFS